MILDVITSSPINVIFSIVIGFGLVYIFYRRPPTSASSTPTTSPGSHSNRSNNSSGIGLAGVGRQTSRQHNNLLSSSFADSSTEIIDPDLERVIAQIERQERDMIRREQDEAYNQSLKADKEKQLKREEEKRRKEEETRLEQERILRQERLVNSLTKIKNEITTKLPPEPTQDEVLNNNAIKLVFKLPDGSRVQRIFSKEDKVKYLYWYVFSLERAPMQFKMTTNFPKRDLPGRPPIPTDFLSPDELKGNQTESNNITGMAYEPNCEETLDASGLGETQIIFVYNLDT